MTRLRVAVVGAGLMGRWHAHAVTRLGGGKLVSVVDEEVTAADRLSQRYKGCVSYSELDQALEKRSLDVVHVCTPSGTHEEIITRALETGHHVLCEKPLAESAQATQELLDLAARHGRLLCPVHQLLFQRGTLLAMRALREIGPLRHLDIVACSAGVPNANAERLEAVAREILPHPLSLVAQLLSHDLEDVSWYLLHPKPGELRLSCEVDSSTVSILISMAGRPTVHTLWGTAENGTIHLDLFHGFALVEKGAVSRARKIWRPFSLSARTLLSATENLALRAVRREPAYPGLRGLIGRFYAAIRGSEAPPISAADTLAVATARDVVIALG